MAAYAIDFVPSAIEDLEYLAKSAQQTILDAVGRNLQAQPTVVTRNRKSLRSNPLSTWELRVGKHRVFYNVDEGEKVVTITAVGWKQHNKLYIRGKEFEL
jgi:mRNA-degrading endonuclease RelE of RelBE toxin-antitoxin system